VAINDALPLEAACDDGIVTYFQFRTNLLLLLSFCQAICKLC